VKHCLLVVAPLQAGRELARQHTAAHYSRSDCIPLLLAAGVDPTAVSTDSLQTALLQACAKRDLLTVQLLLQASAWLPQYSTECIATAVAHGSTEIAEELYTAAAASAAATSAAAAAAAVAAVNSSPICDCLPEGFTLMHVAAAARSLSCAEVLLRHGVNAAVVTQAEQQAPVHASAAVTHAAGTSALDLLVLRRPSCGVVSSVSSARLPELTREQFERFALLLLSCGATIKHNVMSAQQYSRYEDALQKHTARLQQQARRKARVAALHAAACRQSASSSASSSRAATQVVRVQLRHTDTQQLGATVYTFNTDLLTQLLCVGADDAASTACSTSSAAAGTATAAASVAAAAVAAAGTTYSTVLATQQSAVAQQHVLMNMLVPSEGWQCAAATDTVTFISCDGKSPIFIHTTHIKHTLSTLLHYTHYVVGYHVVYL
jgi:trimeric autotransporter adhesin